jgi:hypothetical protein
MLVSEQEIINTIENIRFKLMTNMTPAQKGDWYFLLDIYQMKLEQVKKLNIAFPLTTSIKQNGNR